jgi:hypothetical protein
VFGATELSATVIGATVFSTTVFSATVFNTTVFSASVRCYCVHYYCGPNNFFRCRLRTESVIYILVQINTMGPQLINTKSH